MTRDSIDHQRIDAYLDRVAAALPGPARLRNDILAELRSVLLDATDCRIAAGQSPNTAAQAAIAELGNPLEVAASYRPELAIKQARRLAIALIVAGGAIGVLWVHAAEMSDKPLAGSPFRLLQAPPVPFAAAAFVLATVTGIVTVGITGRLSRWTADRPRAAAISAAIGGLTSAATDVVILILLAAQLLLGPHGLDPLPVSVAATASIGRILLARRAAHRCLDWQPAARMTPTAA